MIETLFFTVAFCLGWRIITDEGNLLYFIRKPFEDLEDNLEMHENLYNSFKEAAILKRMKFLKIKIYLSKPFILCITCFASLWGAAVFVTLNGFHVNQIPNLIINSISASFIQTFIWYKWEELKQSK